VYDLPCTLTSSSSKLIKLAYGLLLPNLSLPLVAEQARVSKANGLTARGHLLVLPDYMFGEIRNTHHYRIKKNLLTKLDRCLTSQEATGRYSVDDKCDGMGVSSLSRRQQNHQYKQGNREFRFLPRASMMSSHLNYLLGTPLLVDERLAQSRGTHLSAALSGISQLVPNLVCTSCDRLNPCADGPGPSNCLLRRSKKSTKETSYARSIQQK
jgi:hypothetical protein